MTSSTKRGLDLMHESSFQKYVILLLFEIWYTTFLLFHQKDTKNQSNILLLKVGLSN